MQDLTFSGSKTAALPRPSGYCRSEPEIDEGVIPARDEGSEAEDECDDYEHDIDVLRPGFAVKLPADIGRKRRRRDARRDEEREIRYYERARVMRDNARSEREHRAEEAEQLLHIGEIEQHPAEARDQQRIDMAESLRPFFEPFAEEKLLYHNEEAVPYAPEDEIPAGTVPEAGQRPDDGKIEYLPLHALAVAAQRDIDVFAEPGAE